MSKHSTISKDLFTKAVSGRDEHRKRQVIAARGRRASKRATWQFRDSSSGIGDDALSCVERYSVIRTGARVADALQHQISRQNLLLSGWHRPLASVLQFVEREYDGAHRSLLTQVFTEFDRRPEEFEFPQASLEATLDRPLLAERFEHEFGEAFARPLQRWKWVKLVL